jgi:gliding motility-associated-like protein
MPYSFVWSNNQTSQNLTSVVSGNYSVTVADSKNCQATTTVYVPQPAAPLQVTAAKTDVACYGSHDGEATLAVNGGTPPYLFEWNNSSAQQNQAGLAVGNYTVTTTDINGCSVLTSVAINQPTPLLVNASATNVLCYSTATGGAQVAVSGGTPGYMFSWSNGNTTQSIGNIIAGIYNVTVTDNQQCSASASVSVSQPSAAVSASVFSMSVSCNSEANGSLLLDVNGGTLPYVYQWSNGAVTQHIQNLSAGSYVVTITDANACSLVLSGTVTEPAALTLTEGHTAVKCYGQNNGTVQLNAGGGTAPYSYHWSNGSNVAASQNLAAGNYSVTVYDANQCSSTDSFTITQPQPLNSVLNVNHALCYGAATGSIQTTVSGGSPPYSYTWSNNTYQQHIQNAVAGNYTLTVSDANGCSVVSNKTIQQPAAISVAASHISPLCFGSANGSIALTVTGGTPAYTYAWSNGATTPNAVNIPGGVHTVTVTDANNCTVSKSVNVSQPAPVVVNEWHSNLSCNNSANGSIQVTATGGTPAYQYFWSNGSYSQQVSNLTAGVYGVTVVDAHGCGAAIASIVVTRPDSLAVSLAATDVKCSETATGTVVSAVAGGTLPYSYHWSNNAATAAIQQVEAGVYSLTVTDANGCTQVSSAMVNDVPPLVVKANADSVPCALAKGDIMLWADGGVAPYTFLWSNGAVTPALQQAIAGVYYVTVADANGCEVDTAFEIENTHQFNVDASGGGTVTLGQTVQLQAVSTGSSQVSYQWAPATGVVCAGCAATAALPTTYTVYTVIATDTNGCTAQDTVSADVIEDYTVFTPNAFTPNGDGNNDYFQFYGNAAGLKYINIMIFDRWGEKLFEADEPTFKWDGMYKGELVPPGVYVYVMKLVFINGHADEIHKGSLTVIR